MLTHLHVYIQHISLFIDPDMDNRDDLIRVPKGLHGFILEVVESVACNEELQVIVQMYLRSEAPNTSEAS